MDPIDERFVLEKAVEKCGKDFQIRMAIEECAELITKLAKYPREINGSTEDEICDEIADVEIMMAKLRIIFDENLIEERKRVKFKRITERVGLV